MRLMSVNYIFFIFLSPSPTQTSTSGSLTQTSPYLTYLLSSDIGFSFLIIFLHIRVTIFTLLFLFFVTTLFSLNWYTKFDWIEFRLVVEDMTFFVKKFNIEWFHPSQFKICFKFYLNMIQVTIQFIV